MLSIKWMLLGISIMLVAGFFMTIPQYDVAGTYWIIFAGLAVTVRGFFIKN